MKISQKVKSKTLDAFSLTKEKFNKTFDLAKIQSDKLKETIEFKIQERAVLALKAELAMRNKTFDNYTDEELEVMIANEKQKIIDDFKTKSLVGVLAILGLDFLV